MRYIVISDVHGEFDKMLLALNKINFDANNDTLITNGDLIDRGPKSKQIIEYVLNCPHHICLWGNHEHLLFNLLSGNRFYDNYVDTHNGVPATLKSYSQHFWIDAVDTFQLSTEMNSLKKYFKECLNAVEIDNYIISHAGAPLDYKNADNETWENYSYQDSIIWYRTIGKFMTKTNIIGHYWASLFRECFDKEKSNDILIYENLICIDGKTNDKNGKVNTFVFESNSQIFFY